MQVILASQSPRRKELMGLFHIPFTVRVSDADESMDPKLSPAEAVGLVSRRKAEAVTREKQRRIIHTAMCYLQKFPSSLQPRFDVVAITALGGTITHHEWIENAFTL